MRRHWKTTVLMLSIGASLVLGGSLGLHQTSAAVVQLQATTQPNTAATSTTSGTVVPTSVPPTTAPTAAVTATLPAPSVGIFSDLLSSPSGVSGRFVVTFNSTTAGQGQVRFGSGPGCLGLVETGTSDQQAGTTKHVVVVTGND